MNLRLVFSLHMALSPVACATTKEWQATGGSRADGVVRLAYEFESFERPQTDRQQALQLARARCAAWGYSGAEPFGGAVTTCLVRVLGDCQSWTVSADYQCTGSPDR